MKAGLSRIALSFVVFGVACGSGGSSPGGANGTGGTSSGSSSGGAPGSGGAVATASGGAPGAGGAGVVPADETLCGAVQLTATKTIAAGRTVAVCAGSTITASSGVSIAVMGTLRVEGTASSPVRFTGAASAPGSWVGLVLPAGGTVTASYLEIHAAQTGVDARAGSNFQIDHLLIDTTTFHLNLASSGTLSHVTSHGLLASQAAAAIVVTNASPQISDTLVNQGSYGGVDLIVVNGATSAPVFDHVEVSDSHCAFHINQGAGIHVTNSFIHHNSNAFMMGASTGNVFSHDNFQDNIINVGTCTSTTAGQVTGDFFEGSPTDSSCPLLEVTNTAAAAFTTDVGPRP